MATYSYKHAVKVGGKIIPANTEIKEPVKETKTAEKTEAAKKKAKAKAVEPETAAVDTAKAE